MRKVPQSGFYYIMIVKSLFLLCVEAMLKSTITQRTCAQLPPTLLRYLLYRAVIRNTTWTQTWIQGLVRYWPLETLSFDFDKYVDHTQLAGRFRIESYLLRNHSWYYSRDWPQQYLDHYLLESIVIGLYLRAYHCHSVDHKGNKQLIVDLRMVGNTHDRSRKQLC